MERVSKKQITYKDLSFNLKCVVVYVWASIILNAVLLLLRGINVF